MNLLVVGELNVDILVPLAGPVRFGQVEQYVERTQVVMGSSSAITACGAARLGVATTLVAVRGDDMFGRFLADELRKQGVSDAGVRVDPALPTGSGVALTQPDGDRAILTALGSIGATTAADVSDELLAAHSHLHVGSYFLQRGLWAGAAELFERARAGGLTTSLDGNFDPDGTWDRGIRGVLAHTDVFFCNAEEARGVSGTDTAHGAIGVLLDLMPESGCVVFKDGAAGSAAVTRTARLAAAPPPLGGELVDTVGAGDSLAAGFLVGWGESGDIASALALGVACGTASTRGAGGTAAQPDRARADELVAQLSVG
jgi:sugar/nucleoside kinase (ribokinase family)